MNGIVVKFEKEKRFGFIRAERHAEDIHFKASEVLGTQYPVCGQKVKFSIKETERGVSAVDVIPGQMTQSQFTYYGIRAALIILAMAVPFFFMREGPIMGYGIAISITTAAFFYYDKFVAVSPRRVPEYVLLGLSLIGGSPAAAGAMLLFRHKTCKVRFQAIFWIIVVLQVFIIGSISK